MKRPSSVRPSVGPSSVRAPKYLHNQCTEFDQIWYAGTLGQYPQMIFELRKQN